MHRSLPSSLPRSLALASLLLTACGPGPDGAGDLSGARTPGAEHPPEQAIAPGVEVPADMDEIRIVLTKREGQSEVGWSFAADGLVPAEEADLTLSSADCGARGRWVFLDANGLRLCPLEETVRCQDLSSCPSSLEIGGSSPAIDIGSSFLVTDDHGAVRRLQLIARTDTPFDWFESADAPFEVVLRLLADD
jgi:hypothetical protein